MPPEALSVSVEAYQKTAFDDGATTPTVEQFCWWQSSVSSSNEALSWPAKPYQDHGGRKQGAEQEEAVAVSHQERFAPNAAGQRA